MLTTIPSRRLAEFEYQGYPLSPEERRTLAVFFGVTAHALEGGFVAQAQSQPAQSQVQAQALAVLAATAALAWSLRLGQPSLESFVTSTAYANSAVIPPLVPSGASPLITGGNALTATPEPTATPTLTATPEPTNTPEPTATAMPTNTPEPTATAMPTNTPEPTATAMPTNIPEPTAIPATPAVPTVAPLPVPVANPMLPQGCPILPLRGGVIVTQGYGVGTHSPAAQWGALDLAIAGGPTAGTPVVATHAGRVTVTLNSWPGGNFISISNDAGWRTGYAHLQTVLVNSGDEVQPGTPIGTVGSTGYSTGPHLHYETWHNGVNLDPTPLLDCS